MRDFAASYSDLDELLVEHVKAMADKVEALTHHEKYRREDQIGKIVSISIVLLSDVLGDFQRIT